MIHMTKLTFRTMRPDGSISIWLQEANLDGWIERYPESWEDVSVIEHRMVHDVEDVIYY